MEECKDIMVTDWVARLPVDTGKSICRICFVWEEPAAIGSMEWILNCMPATCRLSVSGKCLKR